MTQWLELPVGALKMRALLEVPSSVPAPAVLVCMHGPGIDPFIQDICRRLASAGSLAIAPDFYHRQREPLVEPWTRIKDVEALADMAAAFDALNRMPEVDRTRLSVIGFCMGGRLAFLSAANYPDLRAAVMFHGGNIMVSRDDFPSPFAQAGNIRAPMLGLFGSDDTNPSAADVARIDAELSRLGKQHSFHSYAGAGHAFLNFTRPEVFREAAALDAWARCVAWLEQH